MSEKVFAEFEKWAMAVGYKLPTIKFTWKPDGTATEYLYPETQIALHGFRAGYEAGLASRQADGWQPMETAPKDGTAILLATTLRVAESSWGVCRPQWDGFVAHGGEPCWRASGEEKARGGTPLYWMPMPQLTPNDRVQERGDQ